MHPYQMSRTVIFVIKVAGVFLFDFLNQGFYSFGGDLATPDANGLFDTGNSQLTHHDLNGFSVHKDPWSVWKCGLKGGNIFGSSRLDFKEEIGFLGDIGSSHEIHHIPKQVRSNVHIAIMIIFPTCSESLEWWG
jgi:hypothetical protein